ncbi:MAG: heavy metal-binding domain-containing protein [Pseudomonadales bacterium]|nr:heavy metal-binding domain-containing protein [Pseudomonadales bacterium]
MNKIYIFLMSMLLISCGTFVPVQDVSKVDPATMQQAYKVKIFNANSNMQYPEVKHYHGPITAYSCKHMMYDPPASKGDALIQLRLKAVELGANGIVDITFDTRGTDTWGTNCWETVQASGTAVDF